MIEWWTTVSLAVFDALLGWLLALPYEVAVLAVAAGSALILTVVRRFTTNQDLLRRASRDRKRLRELVREARARRDRDAVRRHRATKQRIGLRTFGSEVAPLLVSIVPIAMLATWCLARLGFHPPRPNEPVEVVAYTPVSMAGGVAHLVPADGIEADAWVRPIAAATDDGPAHGMATWTVRAAAAETPHRLVFRLKGRSVEHDLRVGGRTYADPVVFHGDQVVTEVKLRLAKPFGVVPGIEALAFPPWLVAYLVAVVPLVFVLKRLLRVY